MNSVHVVWRLWLAAALLFSWGSLERAVAAPMPSTVRWVQIASPTTSDLVTVDMITETDGWIAGSDGTLLHYDGTHWTPYSPPVTMTLESLSMASATDGWAVGYDNIGTRILRWNGSAWNNVPVNSPMGHITGVSATPSGETWITGGMTFSMGGTGCGPSNPSCPYDGANSWPHLWNGSVFSVTAVSGYYLRYVEAVSSTLAFASGFRGDVNPMPYPGAILRWNGLSWQPETLPVDVGPLTEVHIRTAIDGWAVGRDDILHWDGVGWTRVTRISSPTLISVETTAQDEGWAVGMSGTIQHWDGVTWQVEPSPVSVRLASISLVGTNRGWVVGSGGVILRLLDLPHSLTIPTVLK